MSGLPTAQSHVTGTFYHGMNDTLNYSRKCSEKENRIINGTQKYKHGEIVCGAIPYASDIVLTR